MANKNVPINPEIFRDDETQKNDKRIVIFLSEDLMRSVENWQKRNKIAQRSKAIRFIVRCCMNHCSGCNI